MKSLNIYRFYNYDRKLPTKVKFIKIRIKIQKKTSDVNLSPICQIFDHVAPNFKFEKCISLVKPTNNNLSHMAPQLDLCFLQ